MYMTLSVYGTRLAAAEPVAAGPGVGGGRGGSAAAHVAVGLRGLHQAAGGHGPPRHR